MAEQQTPPAYSIGDVARYHGVAPWQVRRAILRGYLREPARIGPFRVFTPQQLPEVREALIAAGYIREVAHAH
jgi:hypothetical protein